MSAVLNHAPLLPLRRLLRQAALLLSVFSLSRCVFAAVYAGALDISGIGTFLRVAAQGMLFDLSAICAVNAVYLLLLFWPWPVVRNERLLHWLFVLPNALAFLFEFADWGYFAYAHKRSAVDLFWMMGRKADFWNQLPQLFIGYWYLFFAAGGMIWLLSFADKRICRATPLPTNGSTFATRFVTALIVWTAACIGFRGGLQLVPLGIRDAAFRVGGRNAPLALNTPFSIITTLGNRDIPDYRFFPDSVCKQLYDPVHRFPSDSMRKKNVMIIVLESFSEEFTGAAIGGMKSYTPFLDSFSAHCLQCTKAYANGYHSAEGIPAILASLPSLQEEPFTTSLYGANRISGLPALLAPFGYTSAFYHGGTNGTMSFDRFARSAGFQQYVGRNEFPDKSKFDGTWGIWDEDFFLFTAKHIGQNLPQPFVASLFSLSSHNPYALPEQYKNSFPEGKLRIHKTIAYTDFALRRFFETASKMPWFRNTLFVITADHCSAESANDYYNFRQGKFKIPLLLFDPANPALAGKHEGITQQLDVLPSVLDYVGFRDSFFAFGNSIFRERPAHFAVQYFYGTLSFSDQDHVLHSENNRVSGLFRLDDVLEQHNLLQQEPALADTLLRRQQAFLQTYGNALRHNRLFVQ